MRAPARSPRRLSRDRAGGTQRTPTRIDDIVASIDGTVHASDRLSTATRSSICAFTSASIRAAGASHLRRQISLLRNAVAPLIRLLAAEDGELRPRAEGAPPAGDGIFARGDAARRVAALCSEHCAYTGRALIKRLRSNTHAAQAAAGNKRRNSSSKTI